MSFCPHFPWDTCRIALICPDSIQSESLQDFKCQTSVKLRHPHADWFRTRVRTKFLQISLWERARDQGEPNNVSMGFGEIDIDTLFQYNKFKSLHVERGSGILKAADTWSLILLCILVYLTYFSSGSKCKPLLLLHFNQLKCKQLSDFFWVGGGRLHPNAGNVVFQDSTATKGDLLLYTFIQVVANLFKGQQMDKIYFIFSWVPHPWLIPPWTTFHITHFKNYNLQIRVGAAFICANNYIQV